MRMTALKTGEKDVSTLAQRLYPNLSDSARKKAEVALLKANPHLTEAAAFLPGATVVLPSIPGVKPKPGTSNADPVDDLGEILKDAVDAYRDLMATRLKQAAADLDSQVELLKSREVASAIKGVPEAVEVAKDLASSLRDRGKALDAEKRAQQQLFARIGEDLAKLFK